VRDVSFFHSTKETLLALIGLEKDALHIYVGLTIYLLTAILLRLKLRDLRLLGVVFLAAVAGELLDLYRYIRPEEPPRWNTNWHDIWNTMFWPTIFCLLFRSKRLLPG
jgi:cell shape-determining protein MreD